MTSPPPPKSKLVYYALGLAVVVAWFVMWLIRTYFFAFFFAAQYAFIR